MDLVSKGLGSAFYNVALTGSLSLPQFSQMENADVVTCRITGESKVQK